jgi:hypothetical protein
MLPLPMPVPMANTEMLDQAIEKLFTYVNVATSDRRFLLGRVEVGYV